MPIPGGSLSRQLVLVVLVAPLITPPVYAGAIEDQQWHLGALGACAAQEIGRGDGVIVAVGRLPAAEVPVR
jgi:hypothetical protein